jgi:hypothetical protein
MSPDASGTPAADSAPPPSPELAARLRALLPLPAEKDSAQ